MFLIVALTGAAGFIASFALFRLGIETLWFRYTLAVACSYLSFLFFLWVWLKFRNNDSIFDGVDLPGPGRGGGDRIWEPGGGQFGGGGSSGSFDDGAEVARLSEDIPATLSKGRGSRGSDLFDGFDMEELVLVLAAVVALIGAAFAALWIVWAAPALLAELTLDAALSAGLYRRLKGVEGRHWLRTAIRRTWWPFAGIAALFGLLGGVMQLYVPDASSIGQVIQHFRAP